MEFLIKGFSEGFRIHYQGDQEVKMVSSNLPLRCGLPEDLWIKMITEVELGRFVRLYETIPYDHYIQSPAGLVLKQNRDTRLIFHLSHPRKGNRSVNTNTPPEMCTVQYKDLDQAIKLCLQAGPGCSMAKSAFRHLPIHPVDRNGWC